MKQDSIVDNKAKGPISKWLLQEKKASPNFPKNKRFITP